MDSAVLGLASFGWVCVRCVFVERILHSRMALSFTPLLHLNLACMRATNDIHLGCSLLLPVGSVNSVLTLKVDGVDRTFKHKPKPGAKSKKKTYAQVKPYFAY